MLDLTQLAFVTEVEATRFGLVADYAGAIWVCAAVGVLEAFLAEEASAVGHEVPCMLVTDVALELPYCRLRLRVIMMLSGALFPARVFSPAFSVIRVSVFPA